MKNKTYHISGFDCPHCALNSEKHLCKDERISKAVIDYNNERLHISYKEEELEIEEIKNIIKEVEDDEIEISEIKEEHKHKFFDLDVILTLVKILIGVVVIILSFTTFKEDNYFWVNFSIYLGALLIISYEIYISIFKNIIHKNNFIDECLLMAITSIGAFILGSITKEVHIYFESLMVMILYEAGEIIEHLASHRSKEAIKNAISMRIEVANKLEGDEVKRVHPSELSINDIVIVNTGELIPVDGKIVSGSAELDTSSLTGEFLPINSKDGLEVFAGYIVKNGSVKVRVTREYENSAVKKMENLISNSGANKSKADEFVDKFALVYTPIIFAIAILVGLIGGLVTKDYRTWVLLGLKMLVVGCPCAIVISVPLAYFAALGLASKNGIVIKGSNYLDKLHSLTKVVTDKTGTLTRGVFEINEVKAINCTQEELLTYLNIAELYSTHPIARAIVGDKDLKKYTKDISDFKVISGSGVYVKYKNKPLFAGNYKYLHENNIAYEPIDKYGVVIHVVYDNKYLGYVIVSDSIKESARSFIKDLTKDDIEVIMLTGDKSNNAERFAEELGISRFEAELLPEDKVAYLEKELSKKDVVAFIGDGVNDAASIKRSDIGIAMGAIGSDSAIECADIVIMNDNIDKVSDAYRISKIARRVSLFNIFTALFIKIGIEVAAIVTSLLGHEEVIPMWLAVLADTGLLVILVINSLLILYRKLKHKSV